MSFVVTQPALQPSQCDLYFPHILVHRLDSIIEGFPVVFAFAKLSGEPDPHLAHSAR